MILILIRDISDDDAVSILVEHVDEVIIVFLKNDTVAVFKIIGNDLQEAY